MSSSIRRLFGSIGLGGAAALCVLACGANDDVDFSSTDGGGSSGKQSSGGSSGKGTSGSGVGGSSGSGGTPTGGASGSSATGGSGNVSGAAGDGSGGAAASGGASSGGAAGSSGAGASGGSTSTGGSGGSTSTGGSGGSSGVGGGPDGGTCPPTEPGAGDECTPNGLSCNYGDSCCPTTATCSNGHWLVLSPACVAPSCPDEPPEHGTPCDRCRVPAACDYDRCNGDAFYTARCSAGGTWNVTSAPCKFDCGDAGLECKHAELCVKTERGLGIEYSCENNPCGAQPVKCSCADSLCAGPAICSPAGTGGRDVACVCLVCT